MASTSTSAGGTSIPTISVHPATSTEPSTPPSGTDQTTLLPKISSTRTNKSDWPLNVLEYNSALYNVHNLVDELQLLETKLLSKETTVRLLSHSHASPGAFEATLDAKQLIKTLQRDEKGTTQLLFVNRFLIRDNVGSLPKDQKRLRISSVALRSVLEEFHTSPALLTCLVDHGLPLGPYFRDILTNDPKTSSEFWYTVPVRVVTPCTNQKTSHALSAAGSNQMDPSQYLHLGDVGIDIRPSRVVVYTDYNAMNDIERVICFDFQDGRWVDYADEPYVRAKETLKRAQAKEVPAKMHFMHLLVHTSAITWWQDALGAYNKQLIEHEKVLLRERQRHDPNQDGELITDVDTALHTMAAHLHRYRAEVNMIETNILRLSTELQALRTSTASKPDARNDAARTASHKQNFASVLIRVQGLVNFVSELGIKTETVIALSFNTNQMSIDRRIVESSESMRNIMKATQAEARHSRFMARQSQIIAEETRRDSISMKAIALLTMLFLPGTAFAAILSMPFFDDDPWFGKASRVWVWVALTAPSTVFAVLFYIFHSRRMWQKRARGNLEREELDDMVTAGDM